MLLIVWLGICIVAAVYFRDRPTILAGTALTIYLMVPSVGRVLYVGSVVPLHPATVFVLVVSSFALFSQFNYIPSTALKMPGQSLFLVLFVLHALLLTAVGTGATGLLMNNIVGPVLLFYLVVYAVWSQGIGASRSLVKLLISVAVVQASFSLVQLLAGRPIAYEAQYAKFYWFNIERFTRGMGTLDSPLDLALLLVMAIPFVSWIKSSLIRVTAVAVLLGGVLVTQSRLGVGLAILGVLFVTLTGRSLKARLVTFVGVAIFSGVLLMSKFGQGFLERTQNASGSTMRRSEAIEFILENFFSKVLIGGGLNSSYRLHSGGTLGSSLENGFAMYAFDFGWIASVSLMVFLFSILAICLRKRQWDGVLVSVVMFTMLAGYSSFMTQSASGALLFFVSGLLISSASSDECRELQTVGSERDRTV